MDRSLKVKSIQIKMHFQPLAVGLTDFHLTVETRLRHVLSPADQTARLPALLSSLSGLAWRGNKDARVQRTARRAVHPLKRLFASWLAFDWLLFRFLCRCLESSQAAETVAIRPAWSSFWGVCTLRPNGAPLNARHGLCLTHNTGEASRFSFETEHSKGPQLTIS